MSNKTNRLHSLDVLRGLDLFMLVGLHPILWQALPKIEHHFFNTTIFKQLDHVQWEGFSCWDLVMPLFLFMSGVTMPFSLPKYLKNNNNRILWQRVIKRFVILFLLGMIVQGNVLSLDPNHIYIYSNTLQAIAVGYLLTVPIVLYMRPKMQIAMIAILLLIYTIPMMLYGDWTPDGNFACKVDKLILGRFRDGSYLTEAGVRQFASSYNYTWIWSSLTFCCTVALGSIAGNIIKNGNSNKNRTALILFIIGIALALLGTIWGAWQPIIKRIWSASMTVYSAGWCFLLLALFYWWIDIKGHKKGTEWLMYYGCNAICAYVIGEIINFRSIPESLLRGTAAYLGEWYPVLLTTCNSIILFLILAAMYKRKIFLKV